MGLLALLARRLKKLWPELAHTVTADAPVEDAAGRVAKRRSKTVPLESLETESDYAGLWPDAVRGEQPDE